MKVTRIFLKDNNLLDMMHSSKIVYFNIELVNSSSTSFKIKRYCISMLVVHNGYIINWLVNIIPITHMLSCKRLS